MKNKSQYGLAERLGLAVRALFIIIIILIKELIKLSDEQAAYEKKLSESQLKLQEALPIASQPPTDMLHVSIEKLDEKLKKPEEHTSSQATQSSASSLSSPSLGGSTSPMSASGSLSPVNNANNMNEQVKDDLAYLVEEMNSVNMKHSVEEASNLRVRLNLYL